MAAVAILAIVVVAAGYFLWRGSVESRAQRALAEAMAIQEARVAAPGTPAVAGSYPNERARQEAAVVKLKAVADKHASTSAGVFARYQEAAGEVALGNLPTAIQSYQDVLKHSGNTIYTQMAQLGLAEAQARAGQYESAINAFKELVQRKDGPLPIDGVLMQLARTYRDAGKRADAQQTLNRIVQEFPDSPFTPEARRELDSLNKT
jgi:TolA-binding protein